MNYRHIYHAGNFADVVKHIVLVMVLDHLRQKDKPFFVLDTHAGIGLYDLESEEAQKTGEAQAGIGMLYERADAPPEVKQYLDIVRRANGKGRRTPRFYPGSPAIVKEMLRQKDRFVAGELHPDDFKTLKKNLGTERRIRVDNADGYGLLKSQLPPAERRGLVLVDPPFEATDEFDRMFNGLRDACKRWATGVYILWYPVKDPAPVADFHRVLAGEGIPRIVAAEFSLSQQGFTEKLNGCGMIIVNPPWMLRERLESIGPWLAGALSKDARCTTTEIAGET